MLCLKFEQKIDSVQTVSMGIYWDLLYPVHVLDHHPHWLQCSPSAHHLDGPDRKASSNARWTNPPPRRLRMVASGCFSPPDHGFLDLILGCSL